MVKCYIPNYPRPQFVRNNWTDLCGNWAFRFDDMKIGCKEQWYKGFEDKNILVPFTYETKLSGIGKQEHHECVWYSRAFEIDSDCKTLLHFEGSDYKTTVWMNGQSVGSHSGGYSRFTFDITDYAVIGKNVIVVRCEDNKDKRIPRGKQRWVDENFGCWYVQTTGIWKQVWLEHVDDVYLDRVKITPDFDDNSVILEYELNKAAQDCHIEAIVSFKGMCVAKQITHMNMSNKKTVIDLNAEKSEWSVYTWSPNSPNLYDLEFNVVVNGKTVDTVGSYFGLRKVSIHGNKVMLNEAPIYQKLILDQGYWPDSGLTPPSEEALIEDIDKIMALGFNGLRKHQKTEDERFAYWCDVKGLLLWVEVPACYSFDDMAIEGFTREWVSIVRQYYNHPGCITWTPFNESWGVHRIKTEIPQQDFVTGIYHLTKAIDPMRPVITNDGWEHTCSDIITLHDYEQDPDRFYKIFEDPNEILGNMKSMSNSKFAFADDWEYAGQPIIISEYGGTSIKDRGTGWGYGNYAEDEAGLIERYRGLTEAIMNLDYVCGYCYTQVSDVEQEVNGLMDAQRNFKCDANAIKEINSKK